MPGLIAYTGSMPAKRTAARGRLDMVLTPDDEAALAWIEKRTGLNRTGAVRLLIREGVTARGGDVDSLTAQKEEAAE